MPLLPKSTRAASRRLAMQLAALSGLVLLAAACGEDGPNYPDVFDPVAMQSELNDANAAMSSPATKSFASVGYLMEYALDDGSGEPLVLETAAQLVAEGPLSLRGSVAQRLRSSGTSIAHAIPAAALGKTFTYDPALDEYTISALTGAPANGVRFVLYAIDPIGGMPVEPLVEVGHADLTRTATSSSATARVRVFAGTASPTEVLDYTARVGGSVTSPRIEVEGFAENSEDRMEFSLAVAFSLADESVHINWLTEVPTQGLVTRLNQSFTGDLVPVFTIDAAVVSPSGRVDMDGTINDETGGSIVVKVNGDTFATMTLANGGEVEPTLVGAGGEPLTEEEQATLMQIFEWFAGAIFVFAALLGPVGPLLDAAF
jgi:hypothetical protein